MTTNYSQFDKQFIAGEWISGRGEGSLEDFNPYSEEKIVTIPYANKFDVDAAYQAASKAQKVWEEYLPQERAEILKSLLKIIDARYKELHHWLISESGSTHIKGHIELESAKGIVEESISLIKRASGYILPSAIKDQESRAYRAPLGVISIISPWNFPFHLSMRSVAPALALGNSVVLKPASDTPITGGLLLGKLFEEAGLPKGVLNVVVGKGSDIGDCFVEHKVPSLISFTGSTEVGHRVGQKAMGSPLKRVALELGGNAPIVVLDDANIDEAVKATVFGRFLHQGQICMSTNRAIVDESIYDEFVTKIVAQVKLLKSGDPANEKTSIGPLINQTQVKNVLSKIERAKQDGAILLSGGEAKGNVIPPHIFGDVDPNWEIAIEEIFGPVLPIIKARNEEHALELANQSEYGLSSAVFTQDLERGVAFAKGIRAGMTHINDISVDDQTNAPFGGEKNSGIGRFNGEWVLEEFTRLQWVTLQYKPRPYPF